MGFDGYDPYPGESYTHFTGVVRSSKIPRLDRGLEERVEPIVRRYAEHLFGKGTSERLAIVPHENYKGIFDGFSGDGTPGSIYRLFLDRLHDEYNFWNKNVNVEGSGFQFKPYPHFQVEGKVFDFGTINEFDYYFVEVSSVRK